MTSKKNIVIKVKYPAAGSVRETGTSSAGMITEWNIKRLAIALSAVILIIALSIFFIIDFNQNTSSKAIVPSEKTTIPVTDQSPVVATPLSVNKIDNGHESALKVAEEKNNLSPKQPDTVDIKSDVTSGTPEADSKNQNINVTNENTKKPALIDKNKNETKVIKGPVNKEIIRSVLSYDIINKEPAHIINTSVSVSKNKAKQIYYFVELKNMENKTIYHEWIKDGKIVFRRRLNIAAKRWRTASSKFFDHRTLGYWKVRTVDKRGRILDEKEFNISLIH